MPRLHRFLFAGAALVAACGPGKPRLDVVTLTTPTDSLDVAIAAPGDAAGLGGGRWAVVSPQQNAVFLLDFDAGRAVPLDAGQRGTLLNPFAVFAAGDTLYVADWGKRRVTAWSAAARLIDSMPAADLVRGALPQARDAQGRFYVELAPPPGRDGSGNRDSGAVLRSTPDRERYDTAVRLAPLDLAEVQDDNGRRFERRVFSGEDHWGVFADGTIWVARVYQSRVDRVRPSGDVTRGAALPDHLIEVTRYDRELFVRQFPPELRRHADRLPFTPIKPPFEAAFADPGRRVWLERSRAGGDSTRAYLLVEPDGSLRHEVRLPREGKILGVADGVALAAMPTREGSRFIRYRLPNGAAR